MATTNAGASARTRYRLLARTWRRRALGRLYLFTALVMPPLFVGEIFARHLGSWLLGLAAGGVVSLFVVVRDDVPARIAGWQRGYEGERRTAKQLAGYRHQGCVVLHDLADSHAGRHTDANVDHVLVAPWGLFLLDSKLYGGSVVLEGELVRVNDRHDGSELYTVSRLGSDMRGKAVRLHEDIARSSGARGFVHAVVVFWCPFEAQSITFNRVHYVHGDHLGVWLESRRAELNPQNSCDVKSLAAAIRQSRDRGAQRRWWPLKISRA
jgi:hypothetical protein